MNELHQLLKDCREKLQLLHAVRAQEVGGTDFFRLKRRIDDALAKPLHCPTCQCNKLNPQVPALGNPLSRSWHDNTKHEAPTKEQLLIAMNSEYGK